MGATSVSRPVLLPEVRRVQRAARSCASSWSSHSAWGLYARGKVRRSHGWTDCGQTSCLGEHPVPVASCPNTCGLESLTSLSRVPGWFGKTPHRVGALLTMASSIVPSEGQFQVQPLLPFTMGGSHDMKIHLQQCCPFPISPPTCQPMQRQHPLPARPAPALAWNNGCRHWLGVVECPVPQG